MIGAAPRLSLAAYGVRGASVSLPSAPLPPAEWRALLHSHAGARLTWPLAQAIADGALPATEAQAGEANLAHHRSLMLDLLLERELLAVTPLLEDAGLTFLVLKGPAVARLDYPDPAMRSFGDIDLLVPAEQIDELLHVLESQGGRRRFPEPRPGYDRRFGKGASVTMPGGHELDVHRTLAPGPYGFTIDLPALFRTAVPFDLGQTTLTALGPTERFLHACLHAILGSAPPKPAALRDVGHLLGTDLEPDVVTATVAAWGASAPVALAIRTAVAELALELPSELVSWAAAVEPGARDRRWLAAYDGRRSSAAQAIEAVRTIDGPRERAAYLRSIVLPRRAPDRNGTMDRWRRGVRYLWDRG